MLSRCNRKFLVLVFPKQTCYNVIVITIILQERDDDMPPRGKQPSGLLTQQKMLRSAISQFLQKGYEGATTAEIARGAGMTPSSFFRAYPNKEALLLELVKWVFVGQYDLAQQISGSDDPMVVCAVEGALELHTAEMNEQLRELYVTAYTLPSTSRYIYRVMSERLYKVFRQFQPEAKAKDFYEMEIASGSMIRGYMSIPCDMYFTIEDKITRFLDCALKLYSVGEEERQRIISTTLALNTRQVAEDILRSTVKKVEDGVPITGHLIY